VLQKLGAQQPEEDGAIKEGQVLRVVGAFARKRAGQILAAAGKIRM
jgi:hypothetical protein